MNRSPPRPPGSAQDPSRGDPLPTLAELRLLENHLDWLENQRPAKRRRLALLISPLIPAIAIAAALWPRKPHG